MFSLYICKYINYLYYIYREREERERKEREWIIIVYWSRIDFYDFLGRYRFELFLSRVFVLKLFCDVGYLKIFFLIVFVIV